MSIDSQSLIADWNVNDSKISIENTKTLEVGWEPPLLICTLNSHVLRFFSYGNQVPTHSSFTSISYLSFQPMLLSFNPFKILFIKFRQLMYLRVVEIFLKKIERSFVWNKILRQNWILESVWQFSKSTFSKYFFQRKIRRLVKIKK